MNFERTNRRENLKENRSSALDIEGQAGVTGLSPIHNHPDRIRANLQGGRDVRGAHSHLVEKQDTYQYPGY